jgi:hypothetical protein
MLELMEKYPEAAKEVVAFYLEKLLTSLKTESVPEGFKDFVRQKGVDNETIVKIVESSPRMLFDVFDSHELFIETLYMENAFHYTVSNGEEVIFANSENYKTRTECDRAAVQEAFRLLNEKLSQS